MILAKSSGQTLLDHSIAVAECCSTYLDSNHQLLDSINSDLGFDAKSILLFAAAIHDLGKLSNQFQAMIRGKSTFYDGTNARHDMLGLYVWSQIDVCSLFGYPELTRREAAQFKDSISIIVNSAFGHHGAPVDSGSIRSLERYFNNDDIEAGKGLVSELFNRYQPQLPLELALDRNWRNRLERHTWMITGLITLSDWAASSDNSILAGGTADVKPFVSVQHHFGFEPTPLQSWSESVPIDGSPQLFILEDVAGSGKTEAAFTLIHRLICAGASGYYFGLPTMATSNGMYGRAIEAHQNIYGNDDVSLAHSARNLNRQFTRQHWLNDSTKTALLSTGGVGTIDQALQAVLPIRYQSLRMLGLERSVLVVDEVHSSDEYMITLLESLMQYHKSRGGSVVLLSATLSIAQRNRLLAAWGEEPSTNLDFPLATQAGYEERQLPSRDDVTRTVNIEFQHCVDDCIHTVIDAATRGESVVWVRNTVDDAELAHSIISKEIPDTMLFHSRVMLGDRLDTERAVLDAFGKQSTAKERAGKVLISTQVFQESLDVDCDLMISDICPIDDLIQRAGRLHRHTRINGSYVRGAIDDRPQPTLIIHCPEWSESPQNDWLSNSFPGTEAVYRSSGKLWLGIKALRKLGSITMPNNARELIESVYGKVDIPQELQEAHERLEAKIKTKINAAHLVSLDTNRYGYSQRAGAWLDTDIDISTRYCEIESVELVCCKRDGENLIPLLATPQLSTIKLPLYKTNDLEVIDHNNAKWWVVEHHS